MTVGVKVEVDIRQATEMLRRVGVSLRGRSLLKDVAQQQIGWIDRNFRAGGLEAKWVPLKPQTIRRRRKGSAAPLQDSGTLKRSFVTGQPLRLTAREVEVGSNVKYARYHQMGVPERNLPARPLLPSRALADRMAAGLIEAGVRKAIAGR